MPAISFSDTPYAVKDQGERRVEYTSKEIIEDAIVGQFPPPPKKKRPAPKPRAPIADDYADDEETGGGVIMSEQNEPKMPKLKTN